MRRPHHHDRQLSAPQPELQHRDEEPQSGSPRSYSPVVPAPTVDWGLVIPGSLLILLVVGVFALCVYLGFGWWHFLDRFL